jgi:acyl-CoA synthetase (AMP-forming)/AMP-acid ligase II
LGQRIAIVEPQTRKALPENVIGEVWIGGRSVAQGYWNRPEETAATFRARTLDGDGPFLRTGDLGFLRGEELFITGRIKELIIVRGRNYYPDDVERAVWCVDPQVLRVGAAAAFTVEHPEETSLVVVCEVQRAFHGKVDPALERKLLAAARREVADGLGLTLSELVLIPPGTLPKTSSGKIRRQYCRQLFVKGELKRETPRDEPAQTAEASERGAA